MGLFGKILAAPVRIVAAPIRAAENVMGGGNERESDRILSMPFNELAKEIEKVDE